MSIQSLLFFLQGIVFTGLALAGLSSLPWVSIALWSAVNFSFAITSMAALGWGLYSVWQEGQALWSGLQVQDKSINAKSDLGSEPSQTLNKEGALVKEKQASSSDTEAVLKTPSQKKASSGGENILDGNGRPYTVTPVVGKRIPSEITTPLRSPFQSPEHEERAGKILEKEGLPNTPETREALLDFAENVVKLELASFGFNIEELQKDINQESEKQPEPVREFLKRMDHEIQHGHSPASKKIRASEEKARKDTPLEGKIKKASALAREIMQEQAPVTPQKKVSGNNVNWINAGLVFLGEAIRNYPVA